MNKKEIAMHAKLLNDNPLLQEILSSLDKGLVLKSRRADLNNERLLLAITTGFQVCEQIQDYIKSCIDNERVEEFNLKQQKKIF